MNIILHFGKKAYTGVRTLIADVTSGVISPVNAVRRSWSEIDREVYRLYANADSLSLDSRVSLAIFFTGIRGRIPWVLITTPVTYPNMPPFLLEAITIMRKIEKGLMPLDLLTAPFKPLSVPLILLSLVL